MVRTLRSFLILLVALAASRIAVVAQAPADTITVIGVVTDATTRAPLVGVLVTLGDGSARVTTDAQGRFGFAAVPLGPTHLAVRRLGYRDLQFGVSVSDPMAGIDVRLQPDPIALAELSVVAEGKADARGRVLDAYTNLPLPYANVTLTSDGFRRVGRSASSDTQGEFEIQDAAFGGYLLKVERLGYHPQYVGFAHPAGFELDIKLQPNPAMLAAVEVYATQLDRRWKEFSFEAMVYDERQLKDSRALGMREWMQWDAHIPVVPCKAGLGTNCVQYSRVGALPAVYIDELPQATPALEALTVGYGPKDFYRVEIYVCPDARLLAGSKGPKLEIHAYTYQFIERLALRPRALIPACF